jgi:hypothetical protein
MPAAAPEDQGRSGLPLIGMLAGAVGVLWILGGVAAVVALIGIDGLQRLSPAEMCAVAAGVVMPAFMAWFSGAAAHESAQARAEARRLADAADRLLNPERSAEDAARRLAMTVRGEISSLDNALEQTLARLEEVEGKIAVQAKTVDDISEQAKAGANQMISGMEREREELLRISRDLNNQAQAIGDSISRHTHAISEAARKAESEVRAADQALDHRLTSFGAAAALINDRTHGLSTAAQASADSALRLETALSNALDVLAKATNLTDAARQSAEAATLAANSTAGAVRDTTARAVDDAKRAADMIRGEAVNVERDAAIALERLRDAAEAAREAAMGARAALEEDRQRPRVQYPTQQAQEPPQYDTSWRTAPDPLEAPPARPRRERDVREPPQTGGAWTWRDLLSNVEGSGAAPGEAAAPRREAAAGPTPHLRREAYDQRGQTASPNLAVASLLAGAGFDYTMVFSPSGLERIAQRARSGTQARRRAVQEAAPEATRRLAELLAQDGHANQEAMQFLRQDGARIAELLGRGRAVMSADATRLFLLIDAALG